jgi:Flp pilus assembly protein TadD
VDNRINEMLLSFAGLSTMRAILHKLRMHRARRAVLLSSRRSLWLAVMLLLPPLSAIPLHGQIELGAQASELMKAGKFHDAEQILRRVEAEDPKNPSAHNSLGFALGQQGEFSLAAAEYRKSLALDPNQPDVAFALGVTEFKQGHFSAAIPELEYFAKAKPEDPRGPLLLGMCHHGAHEYVKATRICNRLFGMIRPILNCATCWRKLFVGSRV